MVRVGRFLAIALTVGIGVALMSAAGSGMLLTTRREPRSLSRNDRSATRPSVHTVGTIGTIAPPTTTITEPPPAPQAPAWGCDAALAYLRANADPAYTLECPGNAFGHEAMTCAYRAGFCPGQMVIAITDPCPAAYMNEAANSWIVSGIRPGTIDPYGAC
jgi:hypothetical protein